MFDYVVIGAGSAGCVVASRLSEDPSVRVLLLEAGSKPRSIWVGMPSGVGKLIVPSKLNWGYSSEPEPYLGDRKIYVPRGRGLGGTSLINGMAYVRGHAEDYDSWRQMGNRGWGWDDVLPYFKKSEHRDGQGDPAYHSRGGPLWVSDPLVRHPASEAFIEAGTRIGLSRNDDINGARQEGVGFLQYSIRKGRRHSTGAAFLAAAAKRPNLTVVTDALVKRIKIEGKRAKGVEFSGGGTAHYEEAGREVILSAGTIDSPKLLMLSGIGSGEELQAQGIEVIQNLPGVGKNLQDHLYVHYTADSTADSSINRELRGLRVYFHGAYYMLTHRGLLTIGSSQACAWIKVMPGVERPDLQIFFRPVSWEFSPSGVLEIGSTPSVSASCSPLRPHSRGRVGLRSSDPKEMAKIVPNYLEALPDRQVAIAGFKMIRRIFATEPLKSRVVRERIPGLECETDDEILDYVRRACQSQHHWVGTCKMGSDTLAVVDDQLRVRGIEGLRVIDASVMPTISSGNTNAPTIMIGEKGADMIKGRAAA
ncbi:MAG TPA: GMC family oxidoreductase N-terminal domain-containing protein [Rhizomicrobium sp.]|jgi:choline dehydrogenase|nr:GMC family oxidoreductase N-terminal domain-containing protein [Rhizomicrobium sp.]